MTVFRLGTKRTRDIFLSYSTMGTEGTISLKGRGSVLFTAGLKNSVGDVEIAA